MRLRCTFVAVLAAAAWGVGCGGAGTGNHTATVTGSSGRPACGKYCQQAGLPAGQQAPGYPCPQSGCLSCPPGGCVTMLSRVAMASGGLTHVELSCGLKSTCQGAVLLCFPYALCTPSATSASGGGGRLAAADFSIPAGKAATVPLAVTPLGNQVAQLDGGFKSDAIIDVNQYGIVNGHAPSGLFSRTSMSHASVTLLAQRSSGGGSGSGTPGGATKSCNSGPPLFVGPNTTCQFAVAVHLAWQQRNRSTRITAVSPVTKRSYQMRCTGSSPVVCTGGNGAQVVFYG